MSFQDEVRRQAERDVANNRAADAAARARMTARERELFDAAQAAARAAQNK